MKNNIEFQMRLAVYLFALMMAGMFAVFLARVPVRTALCQPVRLMYYACQDGLGGGPLSSSLREFDWRKAFIWRASDTEYRQRQLSQFFEMLLPRLYTHLYYWFGPFMWLPLSLLNAFLIGFMIMLVVRQWCGRWFPGLVAGSFWLMTSEVLIDHHAPMRYAKDFATLEILGLISLLLVLRNSGRMRLWIAGSAICLIWWFGLFTDEYIPFLLPALAVAIMSWPWLKRCRWPLLINIILLTALSFWLFLSVLPSFITPDFRQSFPEMKLRKVTSWGGLILRNFGYLTANTLDNFAYTFGFGWPETRSLPQLLLAAGAVFILLFTTFVTRAWRGSGRMALFWSIAVIFVAGILLPQGTDILHQITYYNRPLIALMVVVLGLFTANVLKGRFPGLLRFWLFALALCAGLNFFTATVGVQDDPEEAYLTRYGLDTILQLHARIRHGELKPPLYVSYPRFRNVRRGVYEELEHKTTYTLENGFPWSLYRSIMPRIYLRHFEEGELRANHRQFTRWSNYDEHRYRAECGVFYDMPAGTAWDLESIRRAVSSPARPVEWLSNDHRRVTAPPVKDLLGKVPYARLEDGSWHTTVSMHEEKDSWALVFALRHDGTTAFKVSGARCPELGGRECSYRWSFQLFTVELMTDVKHARLEVNTRGAAEVIGPVMVPSRIVSSIRPSLRTRVPPAGIPLLNLKGEAG